MRGKLAVAALVPAGILAAASVAIPSHAQDDPASQCSAGVAQRICDTPALAQKQAEMDRKFAQLIAAGHHRATWRAEQRAAQRELTHPLDTDGKPVSDMAYRQIFIDLIGPLDRAISQMQRIPQVVQTAKIQESNCLISGYSKCRVAASGILRHGDAPEDDLPTLDSKSSQNFAVHWQLIEAATAGGAIERGVMLWADGGRGTAQLIGYRVDDAMFDPPRITQNGLLWASGFYAGTGSRNADLLFQWDRTSRRWQDVDLISWQDDLPKHLPKGLEIWKGVSYNFDALMATSPLWKSTDPNCCPSGGNALIEYKISDLQLEISEVSGTFATESAQGNR